MVERTMASPTAVVHPPSKQQIARAIAGGLPAELSQSPLLGILGVVLGAEIVTLTGRMLALGTSDLKGSLGTSVRYKLVVGRALCNKALLILRKRNPSI